MKTHAKKTIREAAIKNETWQIYTKLAEEASELSTAALQVLNKGSDVDNMIGEIGDTFIRMELILDFLEIEGYEARFILNEHIKKKMEKMKINLDNKKYVNV